MKRYVVEIYVHFVCGGGEATANVIGSEVVDQIRNILDEYVIDEVESDVVSVDEFDEDDEFDDSYTLTGNESTTLYEEEHGGL